MVYIAIIIVVLAVLSAFFMCNYLFNMVIAKNDRSAILTAEHNRLETSPLKEKLLKEGDKWYAKIEKKDVYIKSKDGLRLHGVVIVNKKATKKWVVMCHGYAGSAEQIVAGAKAFYEEGNNVLLLDARSCGESEGQCMGMGHYEKYDLMKWVDYLNGKYKDIKIILFGISMGAATVMMASSEKLDNVAGIIEDCGYSSATDEFAYQAKVMYKLPSFPALQTFSLVTRMKAGYWLKSASPIEQVKQSRVPILFIHGDSDTYVPSYMVDRLYDAARCEKEKLVIKGAGHGACFWVDSESYWGAVKGFIEKYTS
jgi:alpha-beta hydrolase superfamily lysophospholipase